MKTENRQTLKESVKAGLSSNTNGPLRKPTFLISVVLLFAAILLTYSNHFRNPFHFDDSHTIVNNVAIRDLGNISKFFSDAQTSSTLPANQAWRPGVTTLNAIDTWFSGGIPNSLYFHISIFCSYILLGIFLFFFFYHLLQKAFPESELSHWASLIGTAWFMLHTANAETINYVIARADSFSTLMVLIAFVMYFYSQKMRNTFLFLLPILIGFFVKEPTIMFAPLLLVLFWLYGDPDQRKSNSYKQIVAAFVLAGLLYLLSRAMTLEHWNSGGGVWYMYLATETFVIVHYFFNFLLPFNLSADTDWTLVKTLTDDRVLIGTCFIIFLLFLAWKFSKKQETKPITFGILWFFIALIPTSTIFSFSEVLNDHRTFFPYIGLVLAFVTGGMVLLGKAKEVGIKWINPKTVLVFACILISLHAVGTYHRNNIWSSGESLWKDVTEKSPGNGRGWMNYGLALWGRPENPDMNGAVACFNKALELYPGYPYANINMGIVQSKLGNEVVAEQYFKTALVADSINPECYYYYGLYLIKNERVAEAVTLLKHGLAISPQHAGISVTLNSLGNGQFSSNLEIAQDAVNKNPTPDNYVNLSLALYNANKFLESALEAKEAAKLKPDYSLAWNNICAAYNKIGEWDSSLVGGTRAVELNPTDELSKNNYIYAQQQKIKFENLETDAKKQPTYEKWISLCLEWDKVGNYKKSMIAAEEATLIKPNDPLGYNNICAAANKLGDWDRAIIAGEKALQLSPDFTLAKNNLAEARKGKADKK